MGGLGLWAGSGVLAGEGRACGRAGVQVSEAGVRECEVDVRAVWQVGAVGRFGSVGG